MRVSIALTIVNLNLPGWTRNFKSSYNWWQSGQGPKSIGWLEVAWPISSLNLPGQYLPLHTSSLSCCAAAAGPQLPLSLQSKLNLNLLRKFKFKFTGKLNPNMSRFNMSQCCLKFRSRSSKSWDFEFKTLPQHVHCGTVPVIWSRTGCKPDLELSSRRYCILSRGFIFKTLPLHLHWQPGAHPGAAEEAAPGTCQSFDLRLAASLTWSQACRTWLGVRLAVRQRLSAT